MSKPINYLTQKKPESIHILRKWRRQFGASVFAFFWGKDSITLVRLAAKGFLSLAKFLFRSTCGHGDIIFLRPSQFRDKLVGELGLSWCAKCPKFPSDQAKVREERGRYSSRTLFRSDQQLSRCDREFKFDACIGERRTVKEKARAKEPGFLSKKMTWAVGREKPKDLSFSHFNAKIHLGQNVRVFSISIGPNSMVWEYIRKEGKNWDSSIYFGPSGARFLFEMAWSGLPMSMLSWVPPKKWVPSGFDSGLLVTWPCTALCFSEGNFPLGWM